MKTKIIFTFAFLMMAITPALAGFPVTRTVANNLNVTTLSVEEEEAPLASPAASTKAKDKWVAAALWFLLAWPFAAHRWYLNSPWYWNILFIITFGGVGVWAIIDIINILTDNWDGL